MKKVLLGIALILSTGLHPLWAADTPSSANDSLDAKRAQQLLQRAVLRYQAVQDKALAEFARQGEFTDNELYVYVLDMDGVVLTSGGSSATLVGRNVKTMRDIAGKPFFAEMVHKARQDGHGEVDYRWLNWADNTIQRKRAFFEVTSDRIIAVGYYLTRASQDQARAFLNHAVAAMKTSPSEAIEEFNKLDGRFIQDDLYVYVIDTRTGRFVAHGTMPRLRGTDGNELRDRDGTPIIKNMIAQSLKQQNGQLQYVWKNPVTQRNENKFALFQVVNSYIVAVGYYKP